MLGVSCFMRDLSLWCVGSLVAACGRCCSTACGVLVPQPGIEPELPELQGVLVTPGPVGSPHVYTLNHL